MAEGQPDANVAPNGTDPQNLPSGPTGAPAEQTPAVASVTLSDDQKSYLKGQGLSDEDLNSPEAIAKIIAHAQSSQKAVAEYKNKLDSVSGVINPAQSGPVNPLLAPTGPSTPAQQPAPTQEEQKPVQGLDEVTAFNLSVSLTTQFPELKEDLMSGKLYQDMQELGIPLIGNAGVNIKGLTSFAQQRQQQLAMQKQLEELTNKPNPIPDVKTTNTVAEDAPMTKQMAQAILVQNPNHPRAEEAKQHLASGKP